MCGGGRTAADDVSVVNAAVGAHLVFGDRAVSRIVPGQSGLAVFALRDREVGRGGPQGNSRGVGRIAVSVSVHRAQRQRVLGAVAQAGHGVCGGGPTAAVDVGVVTAAVGAHLVLPDGVVARIRPRQRDLAVTRRSQEVRRGGRARERRGGRGGCRALAGIVPRAQLERVLGAVGQAGHGVSGGIGLAMGAVGDIAEGRAAAGADLVARDRVAARIGPGQRDRAVTGIGPEVRRGRRERRGGHGGCFAVAANILRTHLKRVCGAAGEAGHGVGGGACTAAADVSPVAVGARACFPAILVSGDRVVGRIVPGQHHPGFTRRGRELRRGRRGQRVPLDPDLYRS